MELKERAKRARVLEMVKERSTRMLSDNPKPLPKALPKQNSLKGMDLNRKKNIVKNKKRGGF